MSELQPENPHLENKIKQPLLRELARNERIVRVAGLKFILPNAFLNGQIIEDWETDFMNTAWHNAIINSFSEVRRTLLAQTPPPTYQEIEAALLSHYDNFEWNGRPVKPPTLSSILDDDQKARIAFARPMFNDKFGGQGLTRKDYELKLYEWTEENAEELDRLRAEKEAGDSRLANLMKKAGL